MLVAIELAQNLSAPMPVYARTQCYKTIEYDAGPTDLILKLRLMIKEREGIPSDCQWLMFPGKPLDDSVTIHDVNVHDHKTTDMIPKFLRC